jgi:hypothetical protein
MAVEREAVQDYHRQFGLVLIDVFLGSPFTVDVERDLSWQQQLLDVAIVRRRRGQIAERLPDGLEDLADHNLITFKSHREALDDWSLRELLGHYVAYRKLVSPSPADLLPAEQFRLYAVAARFPHNLAGQLPWQERQPGVYDCRWGLDTVRVIVAGRLPREPHNAAMHLFSASQELVDFGRGAYRPHSPEASGVLWDLLKSYEREGMVMAFTMADFRREFVKKYFPQLSPEEQEDVLQALPPETRIAGVPLADHLAGLSEEQLRQLLDQVAAKRTAQLRKPRRKK